MRRNRHISPAFYVVQFIELPFEGIDDYVCVPNDWLIMYRERDQKAVIPYPKGEDPFDTRERVERKERYDDKWRRYMAAVKYESDTYWDAEFWIATRNDYGPLVNEVTKIKDTQTKMSIKRSALSEPKKQLDRKRLKLDEDAQSSSACNFTVNDAHAEPGCSGNRQQYQDKQSMECAQTEATAFVSHGESSSSQHTHKKLQESLLIQEQQELRMPPMDVDTPTVVIDDNKEGQSTKILEQQLSSNQVVAHLKPVEEQISVAPSMEITCNNQDPRTNEVLNNEPSHLLLNSCKIAAQLYSQMDGARRLVPIHKPILKTLRPTNIARLSSRTIRIRIQPMIKNSKNPSNPYQTSELPRERQSQPNQQDLQRQPQRPKICINVTIKPKKNRQISTRQGITCNKPLPTVKKVLNLIRHSLLSTHNSYVTNEQQLQANQSKRILLNASRLKLIDKLCQRVECMGEEPPSPYNEVNSDSDAVTSHEVISDHDIPPPI